RFLLETREDAPTDHFNVLGKGTLETLVGEAPVKEGAEVELKLVEVGRHDLTSAVGKLDGLAVCVGGGAALVGKKAKVRIERVLDGTAYATLTAGAAKRDQPITAESEAEKPTRKPPARKGQPKAAELEPEVEVEVEAEAEAEEEAVAEPETPPE